MREIHRFTLKFKEFCFQEKWWRWGESNPRLALWHKDLRVIVTKL